MRYGRLGVGRVGGRWAGARRGMAGAGGVEAPSSKRADSPRRGAASRIDRAVRLRYDRERLVLSPSRPWFGQSEIINTTESSSTNYTIFMLVL